MNDERVIDGVLHRLEGKVYVPMTAEELTARLLEARETIRIVRSLPAPVTPAETWPWRPWPAWRLGDGTGDAPIPGITITSQVQ